MPAADHHPQPHRRSLSSSDDDGGAADADADEQESAIQASIFEQYLATCDAAAVDEDTDALFARGLVRVQEYLAGSRDNTRCLICLGTIRPTEAAWSCAGACFAQFHLPCIQEWGRNQVAASAQRAARVDPSTAASSAAHEWGCPKCRCSYPASAVPQAYTCFCGKQEDPAWDPWLAPHSCGELCGKPLPGRCEHACLLLCHPGPCPPCPRLVDAACWCGKASMKQRCGTNEFSCRGVCGKTLACGHTCPETCHAGKCPPCQVVGTHRCACGGESAVLPCWQADWHCGTPCGKQLACGRHHCDQVCHAGACGPCPEAGERRCPCGKALHPELKCDERAPPCGSTCGKLLDCRVHVCQERCHEGPCNKVCRELVPKPCRCGRTEKSVLCSADVRCDSKCNNTRACGRHPCKRRCCDGNCPPCEEVCNRKLRCGNHRCPATCHSGPCRPCPLSQVVSCACGKSRYTLPCGAEASALPPRCTHPCPVPLLCRHAPDAKPHRCHYGPCPPCRSACGTALPCGHTCSSGTCHDAAPQAIPVFQQPRPPKFAAGAAAGGSGGGGNATQQDDEQQQQAAAAALAARGGGRTPCPACQVPLQVGCRGGHVVDARPCCSSEPFSCGGPCGQPLACGNHTCGKACHVVAHTPTGAAAPGSGSSSGGKAAAAGAGGAPAAAEACEQCSRACAKPRSCAHPCTSRCHPGRCEPCAVACSLECHCGKTRLEFPCWQQQQLLQQQQQPAGGGGALDALCCGKACGQELPFCPHLCPAPCHAGACPGASTCGEEMTVRCSCRRLKEKWPCHRVQAALAADSQGGGGSSSSRLYDGSSALKLLSCDEQCTAAAPTKHKAARPEAPPAPARQQPSPPPEPPVAVPPAADAAAAATGSSSKPLGAKKLSRAEREALAAAKIEAQLRAERLAAWRHRASLAGVALLVLLIGTVLALCLDSLLAWLDGILLQKYNRGRPEL